MHFCDDLRILNRSKTQQSIAPRYMTHFLSGDGIRFFSFVVFFFFFLVCGYTRGFFCWSPVCFTLYLMMSKLNNLSFPHSCKCEPKNFIDQMDLVDLTFNETQIGNRRFWRSETILPKYSFVLNNFLYRRLISFFSHSH